MASRIQRELAFVLTGRDVSASKSLDKVDRAILRVNRHAGKAARNIGNNLETGVLIGATAAAGAIGYAVNAAKDFESSSASVAKTVNGNTDAIINANRALSKNTGLNVNTLNEISATAGALDVAKSDISEFTEVVALLGVTTDDVTTDMGATAIGHLRTTLGLAGSDFREFGDELVYLGNNGASTEGQILSMAENIAGAAATMGASKEQVLAWSAALANTGEEAEAGGSSIQRFWLNSFKAVNKGGAGLKLMAKISGESAASFKAAFGKDATGTLAKFLGSLGKLSKAEQLATLDKLGFKDIRITRALLKLLANTDNLTDSLYDVEHASGAMGKEAEKRFATFDSQVKILQANVQDAAITIGTELLPEFTNLAKEGTDWLQGHQPEIKQFAHDLAGGIHDAVTWAKSLDWDGIANALGAGANAAKLIVGAFASAPPWMQQLLVGGFVANKFTGGVVGDVIGDVMKTLVRSVIGIQAGVVNVNGAVVNGGMGMGGVAGRGASAFGGNFASTLAKAIGGALLVGGGSWLLGEANKQGANQWGTGMAIGGSAAMIAGGAAIFGPIGAIAASVAAVAQTQQAQSSQNSALASSIHQDLTTKLPDMSPEALRGALSGVEHGINELQSNPLYVLVQGDALEQLKSMREDLKTKLADSTPQGWTGATAANWKANPPDRLAGLEAWLAKAKAAGQTARAEDIANRIAAVQATGLATALAPLQGDTKSEGLATRAAIDGVTAKQADSLVAFRDGERTSASGLSNVAGVTRTGAAGTTAATNLGTARIVAAIGAAAPHITTNVYVTPAAVTSATTTQERSGPSTGSRGSGSNGASKPT